jgi:hypothetical protein
MRRYTGEEKVKFYGKWWRTARGLGDPVPRFLAGTRRRGV